MSQGERKGVGQFKLEETSLWHGGDAIHTPIVGDRRNLRPKRTMKRGVNVRVREGAYRGRSFRPGCELRPWGR